MALAEWETKMADATVMQSLFGVDPTTYQAAQQARQEAQAMEFAQLTPAQQAQYGGFRGGQMLGNVGANLLGVEDPMLQKASLARQLAQGRDFTTPKGLEEYGNALQAAGLNDLAMMAFAQSQKLKESQATIYGKTREHLSTMGKLQNERDALLRANPNDPRIAEYNKAIAAEGTSKTPQLSLNAKMLDFGEGRRKAFFEENKDIISQGRQLQQSLTLLDKADASPFAQGVFENKIANAFGGDKQVSRKEAERLANTGSFPTRVENSLRKFASGTISELTRDDQKNVLEAVQGDLKRAYENRRSTVISASASVPELSGQENYYAPTWESTVGGGAAAGKKAYSVGQTINTKDYGILKVTKVDASGNILETVDSKGNVGKPQ